jgi:signal transduction histidine kinase
MKAAGKNLSLKLDCPSDLPAVRGDSIRLREVLQNLLDNAVQYTPSGGTITVQAIAENQVAIAVNR